MLKYRKKPVVVEAWCNIWPGVHPFGPTPPWFNTAIADSTLVRQLDGTFLINTLEGVMRAEVNDWIIRGVAGELYPCKPDIFVATYEAVL